MKHTIVTDAPISDPGGPFFDALEGAMHTFSQQGLTLELEEHPPTLGFDLLGFVHRPTATHVRVWEDYRAKVKYIEIEGADAAMCTRLHATLETALTPPTREQLLARARRSRSDPTALMRAVYTVDGDHHEHDPRVLELLAAALAHPRAPMREIAAYGAGILGWPELAAPLAAALAREGDATAADTMRRTSQTLAAHQPQRPVAR